MRTKAKLLIVATAVALYLCSGPVWAKSIGLDDKIMVQGRQALESSLTDLKAQPGQAGLLVLTNAGNGQIEGRSTEAFLDVASQVTGATLGRKSLLMVHSSMNTPLWAAVFNKENYRLAFLKWSPQGFGIQLVDASPARVLTPEGWAKAASAMGGCTFGVVSLAHSWAKGASWPLLHAACFHNHFCPGLNAGYVAAQYLNRNLPLGKGDKYVFVGAPPICSMDGLQVLFDATMGKSGAFAMPVNNKITSKYFGDSAGPLVIAMRVNAKANKCQGLVLGFDWNKARHDAGVTTMAPPGGPANPLFWIARVKMSSVMATLPLDRKLEYIVKVKEFSGPASLSGRVASGGGNPYSVIWSQQ